MTTTETIAATTHQTRANAPFDAQTAGSAAASTPGDTQTALRFITCGSVDDGKSTLIGRLLVDSRAVLQDHLAGVTRAGQTDLAQLTDGLQAEREQGITIDVAWRYFATEARKFIIGDAPGHEQYTRNMVTAASQADAAVVLVDATKIDWATAAPALPALLPQTRRHSLLAHLLRVPSIVFAINKLDAVADAASAFAHIRAALQAFAQEAGLQAAAIVPISALQGSNVVAPAAAGWCGYQGPSLLQILENLPATAHQSALPLAFAVQWVEKFSSSSDTRQGRRIFWGRVGTGQVAAGDAVQLLPGGHIVHIAQVLDHARQPQPRILAGHSAGIVLDREVDVSRGDWIMAAPTAPTAPAPAAAADDDFADTPVLQPAWPAVRELQATLCWMDDEPLLPGRVYWLLHGHRWVKAKARRVLHRLDIHTLARQNADQLEPNAIGLVELQLQEPIPAAPFATSRTLGAFILVDTASHRTAAAGLVAA
ncbi:MAG: GTP-binding protein [Pseudomonadota bacterium]|nr:GTP-binding protein [Pseudomonadota bacterium]